MRESEERVREWQVKSKHIFLYEYWIWWGGGGKPWRTGDVEGGEKEVTKLAGLIIFKIFRITKQRK